MFVVIDSGCSGPDEPANNLTPEVFGPFPDQHSASLAADAIDAMGGVSYVCEVQTLIANVGETEAAAMLGDTGKPDETVTCHLCRKTIGSLEAAEDANWLPAYVCGDVEVDGQVCSECATARLTRTDDGEYVLIGTTAFDPPPF